MREILDTLNFKILCGMGPSARAFMRIEGRMTNMASLTNSFPHIDILATWIQQL